MNTNDTIVALSTPQGVGAIAVLRLSGAQAIEVVDSVFKGKKLTDQPSHTLHFGTIKDGERVLDEVVVSLFKGPHSYTKEDVVEVSCHGSPYIVQEVMELFIRQGARPAQPGEFTLRAFLHGRFDLSQAEAVADLIASHSEAAHRLAIDQMRGGVSQRIKQLRDELIHFASMIELELDFSEEDVEFADRDQLVELITNIQQLLQQLIQSFRTGNVLKSGVSTVIAGRPNAGKSTLLNALLMEERAIVSDIPGTTRDVIEEAITINGILFRLIDTAGIRDATDKIEKIGVERTMEQIGRSALTVYLFDVTDLTQAELETDLAKIRREGVPLLVVGNKTDLLEGEPAFDIPEAIIYISSLNETNMEALKEALTTAALAGKGETDDTVVTSMRHYEALQRADRSLNEALNGVQMGISGEMLALDIRRALDALGEITGEITTDDLLGNIFSKFCIGK